ncbi:MAG: hypothetical protein GY842_05180 [bacterium]|nr:hypothetical protein [bacterium]
MRSHQRRHHAWCALILTLAALMNSACDSKSTMDIIAGSLQLAGGIVEVAT